MYPLAAPKAGSGGKLVSIYRNVQWFRGRFVFEAHRLLYHSARTCNESKEEEGEEDLPLGRAEGWVGWEVGVERPPE